MTGGSSSLFDYDYMLYLCLNLKAMCLHTGTSYSSLSVIVGHYPNYISRVLCGEIRSVSTQTIIDLSSFFGVSVDYLISWHDWSVMNKWPA